MLTWQAATSMAKRDESDTNSTKASNSTLPMLKRTLTDHTTNLLRVRNLQGEKDDDSLPPDDIIGAAPVHDTPMASASASMTAAVSSASNVAMAFASVPVSVTAAQTSMILAASSIVAAASSSIVAMAAASSSPATNGDGWMDKGCYVDSAGNRTLEKQLTIDGGLTIEKCKAACKDMNFNFAGVEYSYECCEYTHRDWDQEITYKNSVCGNNDPSDELLEIKDPKHVKDHTGCDIPCSGNANQSMSLSQSAARMTLMLHP